MTYEELKKSNHVLFESIRGSHLFGLNTETSDLDTFGLFCCPVEWLLDTGVSYKSIIADDKNDHYYDEISKFIRELKKSNPEALTALFTPEDKILKWDPVLQPLWDIRDKLLTKAAYSSFRGYAKSQINKMEGLSKSMNIDPQEVKVRKSPLNFITVPRPNSDGAWTMEKWLRDNGLKQEHCGVTRLPNGIEFYTLYYDWFADKDLRVEDYARLRYNSAPTPEIEKELEEGKKTEMIKYRGLIDSSAPDTTQIRLSPISKEDSHYPLTSFQYNMNAFSSHCKKYKEYWDWVNKRNPVRYAENEGYSFDAKNTSHAIRIMTMGIEMAEGKGLILDRTGIDRDYLLAVKKHQFTYSEVKEKVLETEAKMKEAFEKSSLPEEPDQELLDDILIQIRKKKYGIH
jgi:predicted nucleotidyltransferase